MIWPTSKTNPAKPYPEKILAADLRRITDNVIEEIRGQYAYVKTASDGFGVSLKNIHALARELEKRLYDLELRVAEIEQRIAALGRSHS